MPHYTYHCEDCGHTETMLIKMSEVRQLLPCPNCLVDSLRKCVSAPRIDPKVRVVGSYKNRYVPDSLMKSGGFSVPGGEGGKGAS